MKKAEVAKMDGSKLAPHEAMEIHELINFKTICLAESKLLQGLCFSDELKALMAKDVQQSKRALEDLMDLYKRAPFATREEAYQ